jgi:hypothetical protein
MFGLLRKLLIVRADYGSVAAGWDIIISSTTRGGGIQ